jgi:hypothetical protein
VLSALSSILKDGLLCYRLFSLISRCGIPLLTVILQQAVVGGVTVLQPLLRGILLLQVILHQAVVGGVVLQQTLLRGILLLPVILH